jgi:putative transposase
MENRPQVRAKIRRWYVSDSIYFITCVTQSREPLFLDLANLALLKTTLRNVKTYHPFGMRGYAFMPDHIHLLIFLPENADISTLLHSIKRNFTVNYKKEHHLTDPLQIWQRGFWDHVIQDERDFLNHLDYIHYNPVKHGVVTQTGDYPYTSFHEYVKRGWYDPDWGQAEPEAIIGFNLE